MPMKVIGTRRETEADGPGWTVGVFRGIASAITAWCTAAWGRGSCGCASPRKTSPRWRRSTGGLRPRACPWTRIRAWWNWYRLAPAMRTAWAGRAGWWTRSLRRTAWISPDCAICAGPAPGRTAVVPHVAGSGRRASFRFEVPGPGADEAAGGRPVAAYDANARLRRGRRGDAVSAGRRGTRNHIQCHIIVCLPARSASHTIAPQTEQRSLYKKIYNSATYSLFQCIETP